MIKWFLNWMERHGRCFVIKDKAGEVYLKRYYLFFNGKLDQHGDEPKEFPFNLFLHKICQSDPDGALHDHPWNFTSLILKGGYYERTPKGLKWYGPLSINIKKATDLHSLEMGPSGVTWTLFFRGKPLREWGFMTVNGWVDFKTFLSKR
jgi:hypothetical protein